jgi:hypothetical protein
MKSGWVIASKLKWISSKKFIVTLGSYKPVMTQFHHLGSLCAIFQFNLPLSFSGIFFRNLIIDNYRQLTCFSKIDCYCGLIENIDGANFIELY